jgi:hypothetical protein
MGALTINSIVIGKRAVLMTRSIVFCHALRFRCGFLQLIACCFCSLFTLITYCSRLTADCSLYCFLRLLLTAHRSPL